MPKVFVAGGVGFLGTHVCELFRAKGWGVIAYDNLSKYELARTGYNVDKARDYNVNFLKSIGVEFIKNDIRHPVSLARYCKNVDYIINCAAQPAMTIAMENPRYDAEVNILGTINLLELARQYEIPIGLCSTIHVFGNGENRLFNDLDSGTTALANRVVPTPYGEDEEKLTGKITPLHVSKYANELYARVYNQSYGVSSVVARFSGLYGPRQFGGEDHGWVANFAIRTVMDRPITIFGTDQQFRDILYASDAAQYFYDWYEKFSGMDVVTINGVTNAGGGLDNLISLKDCIDYLEEVTGKRSQRIDKPPRVGDLWWFCADNKRAKDFFGWEPKVNYKQGIRNLVEWIEENKELFHE